jgi:hypothetical protein
MRKIQYLSPKAHSIEKARTLFRFAWYGQNFPNVYEEVMQKYREKEEADKAELLSAISEQKKSSSF